jgi:hypothetical protein
MTSTLALTLLIPMIAMRKEAREIGQAATLMYALNTASITHVICRGIAALDVVYNRHWQGVRGTSSVLVGEGGAAR